MLAQSLAPLMAEVSREFGGGPVYLSFDSDGIDRPGRPARHPEIGGLTTIHAIEIVRGCQVLDRSVGDLVKSRPLTTPPAHLAAGRNCCTKCSAYCLRGSSLGSAHART